MSGPSPIQLADTASAPGAPPRLPGGSDGRSTLLDFNLAELESKMEELGQPRYRGRQIFQWLHRRGVTEPGQMSNLPAALRRQLAQGFGSPPAEIARVLTSRDALTRKLLVRFADGEMVETVDMETASRRGQSGRRTVCISTQAGCAMGCVFCATGQMGFARQLSPGEIVSQVYLAAGLNRRPVTNLVFMGMGEPLVNYEHTVRAIQLLHNPLGLNLSARAMTLSTVGLVPQIRRLAREGLPLNLAISIHASNDELRSRLMPVNRRWPIAELVASGDEYAGRTGRRVSYEYTLIEGVNDSLECARELGQLLAGRLCHVNLIPLNPTIDRSLHGTKGDAAEAFRQQVLRAGVSCTIRVNRGRDIDAACGQLRLREQEGDRRPPIIAGARLTTGGATG